MCAIVAAGCVKEQPKPTSETATQRGKVAAEVPIFDGARAFEFLVAQTKFGPRDPGSPGHSACLEFLTNELRTRADDLKRQEFTHSGYDGHQLTLTNLIASFNPKADSRVLLCAHWDTRPQADQDNDPTKRDKPILGANDGASGVAVLLELASLLKQQRPPTGVDLVLFDGEDYGKEGDMGQYLLGSRYFAANKPPEYVPRFGILLDMIGDKFLDIPKEQHSLKYAPDIVELVWRKARELGYPQFLDEVGELVTDDHLPLNAAGIKTIDLIDFNYPDQTNRFWHTHNDVPENCSSESLEAVGRVLTHLVYTSIP